mmetsp:Transcript_12893/g.31099  ORF Transcript_12893/g.31099 Transcript_12893/m.31099 type:complete len:250 (+) Transcript_12893:1924-2673(+)
MAPPDHAALLSVKTVVLIERGDNTEEISLTSLTAPAWPLAELPVNTVSSMDTEPVAYTAPPSHAAVLLMNSHPAMCTWPPTSAPCVMAASAPPLPTLTPLLKRTPRSVRVLPTPIHVLRIPSTRAPPVMVHRVSTAAAAAAHALSGLQDPTMAIDTPPRLPLSSGPASVMCLRSRMVATAGLLRWVCSWSCVSATTAGKYAASSDSCTASVAVNAAVSPAVGALHVSTPQSETHRKKKTAQNVMFFKFS